MENVLASGTRLGGIPEPIFDFIAKGDPLLSPSAIPRQPDSLGSNFSPAARSSILLAASRRELSRRHWRVPGAEGDPGYGAKTISGCVKGHDSFGDCCAVRGFISRMACVPDLAVSVSIVTNAVDGLANSWVDEVPGN